MRTVRPIPPLTLLSSANTSSDCTWAIGNPRQARESVSGSPIGMFSPPIARAGSAIRYGDQREQQVDLALGGPEGRQCSTTRRRRFKAALTDAYAVRREAARTREASSSGWGCAIGPPPAHARWCSTDDLTLQSEPLVELRELAGESFLLHLGELFVVHRAQRHHHAHA
jgi:hypothetical protein